MKQTSDFTLLALFISKPNFTPHSISNKATPTPTPTSIFVQAGLMTHDISPVEVLRLGWTCIQPQPILSSIPYQGIEVRVASIFYDAHTGGLPFSKRTAPRALTWYFRGDYEIMHMFMRNST